MVAHPDDDSTPTIPTVSNNLRSMQPPLAEATAFHGWNRHDAGVEVDVIPREAEELPATAAEREGQDEDSLVPVGPHML